MLTAWVSAVLALITRCERVMPWTCPACHNQIAHSELEVKPRPNTPYHCRVCGVDLLVDWDTNRLAVAPVPGDRIQKRRSGRRQPDEAT